jgi:hypothetical protein
LCVRGAGGGAARNPLTIKSRKAAGSITSSISNHAAVLVALLRS